MSDLKRPVRRTSKAARAEPADLGAKPSRTGTPRSVASGTAPRSPKPVDQATLVEIFRRFEEANPHPEGELRFVNPFTLLVAVVLSAQSTDVGVNKATALLFPLADTPQKMVDLGEDTIKSCIRTLNFFNTKARNVMTLSRRLVEEFGGVVPDSIEVLETLPGVGRKTASVVVNIAFGIPRIAVDTHIFRVANRIPLVVTRSPGETQEPLERIVPDRYSLHAHHWLILHGRYVCKARKPECWRCLIRDLCRFPDKTAAPA